MLKYLNFNNCNILIEETLSWVYEYKTLAFS